MEMGKVKKVLPIVSTNDNKKQKLIPNTTARKKEMTRKCCIHLQRQTLADARLHHTAKATDVHAQSNVNVPKDKTHNCKVRLQRTESFAPTNPETTEATEKEQGKILCRRLNLSLTSTNAIKPVKNVEVRNCKVRMKRFAHSSIKNAQVEESTKPKQTQLEQQSRPRKCLSLTSKNTIKHVSIPIHQKLQNIQTECDITSFEPMRNSTQCEISNIVDEKSLPELIKDSKDNSSTKTISNVENDLDTVHVDLCDNFDILEKTLLPSTKVRCRTQKYFNRNETQNKVNKSDTKKTFSKTKKRKSFRASDVFEFLSQSKTTEKEKHKDPAADVIKKMIASGKVRVATTRKGKGRPMFKPTKNKRSKAIGTRKQCAIVKCNANAVKSPDKLVPVTESKEIPVRIAAASPNFDDLCNMDDDNHFDDDQIAPESATDLDDEAMNNTHVDINAQNKFNKIMPSVLSLQVKNQKKRSLLKVAQNFVSTPMNKKTSTDALTNALQTTFLSPIAAPGKPPNYRSSLACQSPWRVPEDSHLPSTFSFARNTSNLPSFSSDFIPSTPLKQKKKPNQEDGIEISNQISTTEKSTFDNSANNSNCENLTPPSMEELTNRSKTLPTHQYPVGEWWKAKRPAASPHPQDIENFIHLPNPRRTLVHRTPFQPINILDVVTLPNWKNVQNNLPQPVSNVIEARKQISSVERQKQQPDNLFGFGEFLDVDGEDDISVQQRDITTFSSSNCTLRDKLSKLKKIRPADEEFSKPSKVPVRFEFDDMDAASTKQPRIKEMLCSTMIHMPHTNTDDTVDLFNECEPELTFDEKKPHHTYLRPFKRKRKVRQDYDIFINSDESEDDESHGKHAQPQCAKKKRTRKVDPTLQNEIEAFANTFNAKCKEIENFEIMVE